MIKIAADDKIPFLKGVLEPWAEVVYLPAGQISKDTVKQADALLVRTRTRCNEELLEGTRVKFIGTATIGFDHIDTGYCKNHEIAWANAPGCNALSVQQYVASALLKIAQESDFSLRHKTLGIIGVGNTGSGVERFARIVGMKVILNDPPRSRREKNAVFSDLEQVLIESDIITLHVPLNLEGRDKTLHLFNDGTLAKLKKESWLINTSRGEVIDTYALKELLGTERIRGAVVDVWEKEPELDIPLMHMSFLATPHIAGYSTDGKANGTAAVVRALCEFFRFPLKGWYPSDIPPPPEPVINIDCNGKSDEEIVRKAVFHTYNILQDDVRLRFDPARFEMERSNYPLRREFQAYTVDLNGGSSKARKMLEELGFKIAG